MEAMRADAIKGLRSLDKAALTEMKSFKAPPALVIETMGAVQTLLGRSKAWKDCKVSLGEPRFLASLLDVSADPTKLPAKRIRAVRKFTKNSGITWHEVKKRSVAAAALFKWAQAVVDYAEAAKGLKSEQAVEREAEEAEPEAEEPGNAEAEAAAEATQTAPERHVDPQQAVEEDVTADQPPALADADALAEAKRQMAIATKSLDSLSRCDLTEVKAFAKPPEAVKSVLSAVQMLLGRPTAWRDCKKSMANPDAWLTTLKTFRPEEVTAVRARQVQKFVDSKSLSPERVKQVSCAAAGMCKWVLAVLEVAKISATLKRLENPQTEAVQASRPRRVRKSLRPAGAQKRSYSSGRTGRPSMMVGASTRSATVSAR